MNLTQTGVIVKKAGKFLLVFFLSYYVFILLIKPGVGIALKRALFKPTPPNPAFGLLDPLEFVEKPINGEVIKYTLNTKNGRLPSDIPEIAPVYRFKAIPYSYLAGKNAVNDAISLGFSESDLITDLKGNTYKWRSIKTGGLLEIQIETKELKLSTSLATRSKEFPSGGLTDASAKKFAKDLFINIGRFNDGLYPSGVSTAYLGKFTLAGSLVETQSPAEAQIARVDFFRNINNKPIVGPDPTKGLLNAYVRKPLEKTSLNNPIVEAYFWEINPDSSATYPIITVDEAWNAIKTGKGVVTSVIPKNYNHFAPYTAVRIEDVLIDNIYIAYYETPKFQKFLQPIYIFTGKYTAKGTDGGYITIYFPAITRDYTKQLVETPKQ